MSRKIKERTKQLAAREKEIKGKLLGTSNGKKSKAKRIGKTALVGGILVFILYSLYKAFFQEDVKPKKNKVSKRSTSGIVTEKLVMFLLPYLGEFLEGLIKRKVVQKDLEEDTEDKEPEDNKSS